MSSCKLKERNVNYKNTFVLANLFEFVTKKVKIGETRIVVIVMVKSIILKRRYPVSREAPFEVQCHT